MDAAIVVALLSLLFGGTHLGLASSSVRRVLVARLGERGFLATYYAVAIACLAALVMYYAGHRFEGPPGLGLATAPPLRWSLMGVSGAGVVLMAPALAFYDRMPMALFDQAIRSPRGVERITRHPFFMGFGLFALAHALLATHLVGTVFFAGWACLAFAGARHQDAKHLARRGRPYADYLDATSAVPFAAIVAGRQRLVWREIPTGVLLVGLALAVALHIWHDMILADGGAWFIGVFAAGSLLAAWSAQRRARRTRARDADPRRGVVRAGRPGL